MKDTKRHIDEFFQEELGAYTEMPPSSVWENLEQRLDNNRSRSRKALWWMLSLIAIVFVGGSIAAYYYTHKSNFSDKASFAKNQRLQQSATSLGQKNEEAMDLKNLEDIDLNSDIKDPQRQFENSRSASRMDDFNTDKQNTNNRFHNIGVESNVDSSPDNKVLDYSKDIAKKGISRKSALNSKDNQDFEPNVSEKKSRPVKDRSSQKVINDQLKPVAVSNKIDQGSKQLLANKSNQITTKPKEIQSFNSKANDLTENSLPKKRSGSTSLVNESKENKSALEKSTTSKRAEDQKTKVQTRGLSAFPEEDAAELMKDEAPSEVSPEHKIEPVAQQKVQSKSEQQVAAITQIRAQNPLAAAPSAVDEIDESTDENGNQAQESASGGGGGATAATKTKTKKSLNMAIGVKMGYERGTQNITAEKYVGSIFAEISLGKRLSFILQPSIKMANTSQQIGSDNIDTFVNAKGVSNNRYKEHLDSMGAPTGFYDFAYSQQYDSMVQSAISKRSFIEIEIPFLFKYKVDKNFSVLAGMNFIFGKTPGFELSERKLSGGSIQDTTLKYFGTTAPSPSAKFLPSGTNGKLELSSNFAPPINPVRFGYTLGLSYVFKERVMIDFLVQQNLSGISNISNAEVRKIFEQPYVRLSLGYTIFGASKK